MKRRTIAGVLFLSFVLNVFYCIAMAGIVILQKDLKLMKGASAEVADVFSIPTLYIIFAVISILMQLVMVMSFSNSMRFSSPTVWVEGTGCLLFGGVFRVIYHYIPAMGARFSQFRGTDALASREMVNQMIQNFDWLFALASSCFLVGAGMTICFKKFIRYFVKS